MAQCLTSSTWRLLGVWDGDVGNIWRTCWLGNLLKMSCVFFKCVSIGTHHVDMFCWSQMGISSGNMWQSEWSIEAILTNIGPKYIQMYCRCIYHTWNTWASYGQRLDDKGLLSLIRCGLFQLHGCLFLDCWFGIQEFHYNEDNHKLGFSMECKPPTYTICQPYFNQRRVFLMFTISKRL